MAVALDGWLGHRDALRTATEVQDRLLLGAARIVAEHLRFEDGSFRENIPPAALELFQAREVDRIFYRVTTVRGRLITATTSCSYPGRRCSPRYPSFMTRWSKDEGCARWPTCSPSWASRACRP
jgi:two-component system sensor histidine kinase TctE